MNEDARLLTEILDTTCIGSLLSDFGKNIYFPKGIMAQATEASKHASRYNASAGIALEHKQPLHLSTISSLLDASLLPSEVFSYAPSSGDYRLRKLWQDEMKEKNPRLTLEHTSMPLVTCGLTHSLSIAARLCVERGDEVILPDLYWDNYDLIFAQQCGARLKKFPFFSKDDSFNLEAMEACIRSGITKTVRLILNFPNNPTGYTPSEIEMVSIANKLKELAEEGYTILVFCDDAYFGLFFEAYTCKESLFSLLSAAHERIVCMKGDAATKEDLVWGFRIGFITFGGKALTPTVCDALEKKILGSIRATVSSNNRLAQTLLIKAMEDKATYSQDKRATYELMKARYNTVKDVLASYKKETVLKALPFNSGYFLSFLCKGSSEELRTRLLEHANIGTISLHGNYLRLAYSAVDTEDLSDLLSIVYQEAAALWN